MMKTENGLRTEDRAKSLERLAKEYGCKPSFTKSAFMREVSNRDLTIEKLEKERSIFCSRKVIEAEEYNIHINDTTSAYKEEWYIELIIKHIYKDKNIYSLIYRGDRLIDVDEMLSVESRASDRNKSLERMASSSGASLTSLKESFMQQVKSDGTSIEELKKIIIDCQNKKMSDTDIFDIHPNDTTFAFLEDWFYEIIISKLDVPKTRGRSLFSRLFKS